MYKIGENIHIISPKVKEGITNRDGAFFVDLARRQKAAGADALDLNVGPRKKDGPEVMTWLVDVRGHHRLTVDPAAENARAIHVYQDLGFRPVGVLKRYERVEDGVWRDALLMELLAADFKAE